VQRKTGDGEEEVPGEYTYNGSVANKALELLGKELGMFIDRKEIGGLNEFARMSDEELDAFPLIGHCLEPRGGCDGDEVPKPLGAKYR
jgi:hypothetical protein